MARAVELAALVGAERVATALALPAGAGRFAEGDLPAILDPMRVTKSLAAYGVTRSLAVHTVGNSHLTSRDVIGQACPNLPMGGLRPGAASASQPDDECAEDGRQHSVQHSVQHSGRRAR